MENTMRFTIPEDVLFRQVGDEAILLNLETEFYYSLDEVGARMWSVLASTGSLDAVESAVVEEYDAPAERVRQDLDKLVSDLVQHGLLEQVGA